MPIRARTREVCRAEARIIATSLTILHFLTNEAIYSLSTAGVYVCAVSPQLMNAL